MINEDVYGEPEIIKLKNSTATVYSPILTEEERTRRMNEIKKAAAALLRSSEERKKNERQL